MNADDSRLFFTDARVGKQGTSLKVPEGNYFVVALSNTRLVTAEVPVRRDRGGRLVLSSATVRPAPTYAGLDLVASAYSLLRQPAKGVGLQIDTAGRGRYYVSPEAPPTVGRLSSAIGPTFADVEDGTATALAVARRQFPGIPENLSPALDPETFEHGLLETYGHGAPMTGYVGSWGFLPQDFFAYNAYVQVETPGSIPFDYSGPRVWRWLTDLFVLPRDEQGNEVNLTDLSPDPLGRDDRLTFLQAPSAPGRDTGGRKAPGALCTLCTVDGRLIGRIPLISSPGTSQLGNTSSRDAGDWRLTRGSKVLQEGTFAITPRVAVSAGDRLTLSGQVTPDIPGWTLGDHASSTWTFTVPKGDASVPLLRANWTLPTRLDGRIPAAKRSVSFPVRFDSLRGPNPPRVTTTTWEYRVDDGLWRSATVARTGPTSFGVTIPNPNSGRVSVRMSAAAADGSRVAERVDHAWGVATSG